MWEPSHVQGPHSRRAFLVGAGRASLLGALALPGASFVSGCGSSDKGKFSSELTILLPGDVPPGWPAVLTEVNKRLKTDLGFTIKPQFIAWDKYGPQALQRFKSGGKVDTALQARWLNMDELVADKALVDVAHDVPKYRNLSATLDETMLKANMWGDALYGIPQVNSAARLHHFAIRQDLAEELGFGEIADFETLERFWYAVKQRKLGVVPFVLDTNSGRINVFGPVTPTLNAWAWQHPSVTGWSFAGDSMLFAFAPNAFSTGKSNPVPFWEQEGVMDSLDRVRRYHRDDIINRDILKLDKAAAIERFSAGKAASMWVITDGTSSDSLPALRKAVPGAQMANVAPLAGGLSSKPNQTFQAENFVVLNTQAQSGDAAMALEDWVSTRKNYDLVSYGIEGRDWVPHGKDGVEFKSAYNFPGFALTWRIPLFRNPSTMTDSERTIFEWSKDPKNFTFDTFAFFVPDVTPVERQNTQMVAAMTQYARPLFAGVVDVSKGLDRLKRAAERAGLDQMQAEMAKQADAYLTPKR